MVETGEKMPHLKLALCAAFAVLTGCANLNPLAQKDLAQGFPERALEINRAYRAELNAQILENVLRARDRQNRLYTTASPLKITPQSSATTNVSSGEIGLGNNAGDPWAKLGSSHAVTSANNLELTFAKVATEAGENPVFRTPISVEEFLLFYSQREWPKDIVEALLIAKIRTAVVSNPTLTRQISEANRDFYVFVSGQELHYCFEAAMCPLVRRNTPSKAGEAVAPFKFEQLERREAEGGKEEKFWVSGSDQYYHGKTTRSYFRGILTNTERSDLHGSRELHLSDLTEYVQSQPGDRRLSRITCWQKEQDVKYLKPGGSVPGSYNLFQCSKTQMNATLCVERADTGVCKTSTRAPMSMFYVVYDGSQESTKEEPDLTGIYAVSLNSIDGAIFTLGDALSSEASGDSNKRRPSTLGHKNIGHRSRHQFEVS